MSTSSPASSPLRTLARVAGAVASRGVLDLGRSPARARQFWRRVARAILVEPGADHPPLRLPRVALRDLLPSPDDIPVSLVDYRYELGDMCLAELVALCRIVRCYRPRVVFEIGTFHGGTTLQMAANCNAQIYTLDLPPDAVKPVWNPTLDVYPEQPGARFRNTPYASRITQLWGDSRTFDYRPYHGQCDLVFVDACHHYEFVKQDSANALRLVSPTGWIIWHDYAPEVAGVVQALEELNATLPLAQVDGTCFVVSDPRHRPHPAS